MTGQWQATRVLLCGWVLWSGVAAVEESTSDVGQHDWAIVPALLLNLAGATESQAGRRGSLAARPALPPRPARERGHGCAHPAGRRPAGSSIACRRRPAERAP